MHGDMENGIALDMENGSAFSMTHASLSRLDSNGLPAHMYVTKFAFTMRGADPRSRTLPA